MISRSERWHDTTLGDFVALQRGHDLTEPQRRVGRVPVMGSAGQNGFHDTALAKGPGIVIGRSGASFGQVHFSKEDFWPHNTGLYVTDFKGNDPLFAFYFLKALDFDRFNSGSAQPSLNRNFIYPIPIRVPKPAEQKAIAAVLGALDDKIENNRKINHHLPATPATDSSPLRSLGKSVFRRAARVWDWWRLAVMRATIGSICLVKAAASSLGGRAILKELMSPQFVRGILVPVEARSVN